MFDFSEKDSCGVGFIASRNLPPTHGMTLKVLECLANLDHRGAKFADGTGDGAGVLTEIPFELIRAELAELNIEHDTNKKIGIISCFFDPKNIDESIELINNELKEYNIKHLYWRKVPTDKQILGTLARESKPSIYQSIVSAENESPKDFEKKLYLFRKTLERKIAEIDFLNIHVNSCSSKTVVYKGLFTAKQTADFYWDLRNPLYKTRFGIFHQRFSTNTSSTWDKAQPFRMLAHNGEINTIQSNYSWMKAREVDATSSYWKDDIESIKPFIDESISDSGQLDNAIELLVRSGRTLAHSQEMLIPSAWENNPRFTKKQKAFYQYHSFLTEPWDGPAAIVASDGRDIIAGLDRSGLRPMRWMVSDRYVLAASEVGICPSVEAGAYKTAQLEPGQTIRYRIENDELLDESQVITKLSEKNPYIEWVNSKPLEVDQTFNEEKDKVIDVESLSDFYEYTPEEERLILLPMLKGEIPTGSMGNDTSLAVMSKNSPRLTRYFHQLFAQVTNPPIDPIRERFVMSTKTYLGKRGSILKETAQQANLISLDSPILSGASFDSLTENKSLKNKTIVISSTFIKENKTLEEALEDICEKVKSEILENNKSVIIFSDREIKSGESVVPSLMVIGKVHHYLIEAGIRLKASLISVSGEIRDSHDVACHISYGASAVWPYLALEKVRELSIQNETLNISIEQAQENYRNSLNTGLLKIMSKMGICTISSYRGSELFEIIGLNNEIVNSMFKFSKTRTEGYGFEHFNKNLRIYQQEERADILKGIGGFYKHKKDAETHVTSPKTVLKLQKAVRSGEISDWHSYLETLEDREDVQLRDLFSLPETTNNNVVLEDDSLKDLYKKFTVSSMSLGALSEEAHQALAIAINQIGGKSGSGEGGEDPARYDNEKNSKIKQIASGRFGVTPDYLASAEEFQIKMAQGSKPGEGGQLPGFKVDKHIAKLRHTVEGVTLISPPPHHDIYSIEDLAQLIYDLKTFNPANPVSVKLVSEPGVGTIAVGVAKAGADIITIAGSDGGTGASPWISIKHAGSPWELGLSETHQALVKNNMRHKVLIEVDGGLRSAKDVIIGTILGADRFGFGTLPLLALGCKMVRQCHENTCPVGIATQDENLRAKFPGAPEQVVQLFKFIANDVMAYLDKFGVNDIQDLLGRADLLGLKISNSDLSKSLHKILMNFSIEEKHPGFIRHSEGRLSRRITSEVIRSVERGEKSFLQYPISNEDRSIGARLSGEVTLRKLSSKLTENPTTISLSGAAGQSFGAFIRDGINLKLTGNANDYVAKGMGGGSVTIIPQGRKMQGAYHAAGNTILYGATGGQLFIAGTVGQRFGVRNSGAIGVVEGCSAHGAEYMTGGTLVILGNIGFNFAAGMTGGKAIVLKTQKNFEQHISETAPEYKKMTDIDKLELKTLIEIHIEKTNSETAKKILDKFDNWENMFAVFGGIAEVEKKSVQLHPENVKALD
ncbi:MAG: glutamate synthase large subunit [Candidatus Actinomarina sp.]|jgi:glutamate synthase (NADPH/NADH) large chain|nr:glutamate synthase large subunit [Candidatus Actinomarina sp.]MBL6762888.1 glutamate synthase large subunit [Candidatus Actinomarina sp.]MBL6835876.1 glutamate synthase large subunit [Candidatus Actinomarina sp.]